MLVAPQAVDLRIRIAVGHIVVEAVELDVLIHRPLGELVGAGADKVLHRDEAGISAHRLNGLRRVDHRRLGRTGQHVQQHDRRVLKGNGDGVVVHGHEGRLAHHLARGGEALQPAVQGGDHIGGGHLLAVVEEHALAQVEGELGARLVHLIGFAQLGADFAVGLERDQLLEHRTAKHIAHVDGGVLVQVIGSALIVVGDVDHVPESLVSAGNRGAHRQQHAEHQRQSQKFTSHLFLPPVKNRLNLCSITI